VRYQTGERGSFVVNCMQMETGTEWGIKQGNGGFALPAACKLEVELIGICDGVRGFVLSTACKLKLESTRSFVQLVRG
jgi:hypothetical protein